MVGTPGNLLILSQRKRPTAGHTGHGRGNRSWGATCCPAARRMPAVGLSRWGNGGAAVGSPTTPSNKSQSW